MKKSEKNIVNIDGVELHRKLLQRWTDLAKECYNRKCNCFNCHIIPPNSFHEKCNIKYYVKGYIMLGVKQ